MPLSPQTPSIHDRCAGVLLAGACGDALGAGYELGSAPLEPVGHAQMIGGGLGNGAVGEWTDDTAGAVALARGILAAGGLASLERAVDHSAQEILAWYENHPPDVGNQTRAVLSAARRRMRHQGEHAGAACTHAAAAHLADHPQAAGNGSLMRTGAVALGALGNDELILEAARALSGLTHAGPVSADACALWSIGVDRAVREGRLDGVFDALALLPETSQPLWGAALSEVREAVSESQRLRAAGASAAEWAAVGRRFNPNGYVLHALQGALWAALASEGVTLRELGGIDVDHPGADAPCTALQVALQLCVAIGGDTDTTATICGSLVGARWGASAVPARWRRELHGWPGITGRDLVSLGVELEQARGQGVPASSRNRAAARWPRAERVAADDAVVYRAERAAVASSWDPGLHLGTSASLVGLCEEDPSMAPMDAVVSLSRIGTAERPPGVAPRDHLEVWLVDDEHSNPNLEFVLADAADGVRLLREEGRSVLLHCVMAQHRTPAVAAADAVLRGGLRFEEARRQVQTALPSCGWRRSFTEVLGRLEG